MANIKEWRKSGTNHSRPNVRIWVFTRAKLQSFRLLANLASGCEVQQMRIDTARRSIPPIAFLLLAGCQFGVDVSVSGPSDAPTIELKKAGLLSFGDPNFATLAVFAHGGEHSDVWRVDVADRQCDVGTGKVIYGRVPAHFKEAQRPSPLQEGQTYEIMVNGCGSIGGTMFKVEGGKILQQ